MDNCVEELHIINAEKLETKVGKKDKNMYIEGVKVTKQANKKV